MMKLQAVGTARVNRRGSFFLVMSLLLAGIATPGFSHTVPSDFAAPDFPLLLWVHAGVFTAWVVLFVAQPALVMGGSVRLHRRLGWVGVGLAISMVTLGALAVLLALWSDHVPPFYPHGLFLTRGLVGLLLFSGLVIAGVLQRQRPEWHKRLLLCASIIVVAPGLERAMPLSLFGPYWPFVVDGVIDLLAVLGAVVDLVQRQRVHPAYWWGIGSIVLGQLVVDSVAPSPVATALLHAVGSQ